MTEFDEKQTWNNNILKDLMSFLAKEDRFSRGDLSLEGEVLGKEMMK